MLCCVPTPCALYVVERATIPTVRQGYCRVLYQQYYGRYISPNQIRSRLKAASGLKYGNRVDQRERSAAHAAQHPMPADPLAFRQVFS